MLRVLLPVLLIVAPAHADRDGTKAELATYGAVYGLALGAWTSAELDLNLRPAAWVSAATTTGGIFGGLQLVDGLQLNTGQVRMMASAAAWTAFDTFMLAGELDWLEEGTVWTIFAVAATGAAGALVAATQGLAPSTGDMSLVNSGGLWMVPAGLLFGFTFHLGSGEHIFRDILIFNVLGLGTGVALAHAYDPSRGQVLSLDAGLLAGGLAGGLLGVMVAIPSDAPELFSFMTLLGMAGGGWIALELVGFDAGSPPKQVPASGRAVPMPLWVGTW